MSTLHLGLLAASVSLLGITAATSPLLRRYDASLPAIGFVLGAGLTVGNAACLLPSTPLWYSVVLVVLTVAGAAWFAASVVSARAAHGRVPEATHTVVPGTAVRRPVALHVVRETTPQPSLTARPAPTASTATASRAEDEPRVATQETFRAAGPQEGWATTGQGTYVAAHLERYVDGRGTRRAHGSYGPRQHSNQDPTARFLSLARAYGIEHPGQPRHSSRD